MKKTVGALLFPGFELLDVFGPLEAWGMLADVGQDCQWELLTVAQAAGPVASAQHVRAVAEEALTTCPKLDVLLVPGGMGTRQGVEDASLLDWLRARSADAEVVTSVCTGSGLLARAGLLDGRRATSNKASFGWVVEQGPRVGWVKEARWVSDGKFFTSSGVSAGIDMTLAVIAQLETQESADRIANRMEYEWHRDPAWDPFAKIHGLV